MKKYAIIIAVFLLCICALGFGRRTYDYYDFWRTATGGIEYTGGNVNITNGNIALGTDVYVVTKTVIKTIDANDDSSTDDFQFDDDASNSNEQTVDMGAIIPAFAEVVSVQLRCFETFGDSNTVSIDLGISDGGAELLAAANIDTANDIDGTATGAGPKLESSNAARNVWINANPTGDWDKVAGISNTGRWAVMVTYLDYGAVYTAKNP